MTDLPGILKATTPLTLSGVPNGFTSVLLADLARAAKGRVCFIASDAQMVDAMMEHPILINRPIVVTPVGVKLCRPSEAVLDILPVEQRAAFTKEDGEVVVDDAGRRVI